MEFLRLSKDTLVNWSLLPQVELVSNSEDDAEVAMAKVQEQMEQEQQEEMQVWARAITVMQGGGTPGPSSAVAVPMPRACERCMVLLQEPEGCVVSEQGKARACLPSQKAHKACIWPLGAGGVGVATGSRTKVSGKPAPR